ncbi:MAG: hypothetical protein FWC61_01995 [Proteobacteria bacterium]|nr:hypothetical protein [Pseudomonadota bacterium]
MKISKLIGIFAFAFFVLPVFAAPELGTKESCEQWIDKNTQECIQDSKNSIWYVVCKDKNKELRNGQCVGSVAPAVAAPELGTKESCEQWIDKNIQECIKDNANIWYVVCKDRNKELRNGQCVASVAAAPELGTKESCEQWIDKNIQECIQDSKNSIWYVVCKDRNKELSNGQCVTSAAKPTQPKPTNVTTDNVAKPAPPKPAAKTCTSVYQFLSNGQCKDCPKASDGTPMYGDRTKTRCIPACKETAEIKPFGHVDHTGIDFYNRAELYYGETSSECFGFKCKDGYHWVNEDDTWYCEPVPSVTPPAPGARTERDAALQTEQRAAAMQLEKRNAANAAVTAAADKVAAIRNAHAGEKASVWKNASGGFNTSRLASDSIAGVALGTVGGIVTANIIKKNQIRYGFEDLNCSVAGTKVADWGDTFFLSGGPGPASRPDVGAPVQPPQSGGVAGSAGNRPAPIGVDPGGIARPASLMQIPRPGDMAQPGPGGDDSNSSGNVARDDCIAAGGSGRNNVFVWAARNAGGADYATLNEDTRDPDNNACWVRVDMVSDDPHVQTGGMKPRWFMVGQNATCGGWLDAKAVEKTILDAKKTKRTWGTVAGAVGGAAVGVGAMELFGNRLIGGSVEGQKDLERKGETEKLLYSQMSPEERAAYASAQTALQRACADLRAAGGSSSECK